MSEPSDYDAHHEATHVFRGLQFLASLLSVLSSVLLLVAIFAHRHIPLLLYERLVALSSVSIVWFVLQDLVRPVDQVLSDDSHCVLLSVMNLGRFSLIFCEIGMMWASLVAIKTGRLGRPSELLMYVLILALSLFLAAIFLGMCNRDLAERYAAGEHHLDDAYSYLWLASVCVLLIMFARLKSAAGDRLTAQQKQQEFSGFVEVSEGAREQQLQLDAQRTRLIKLLVEPLLIYPPVSVFIAVLFAISFGLHVTHSSTCFSQGNSCWTVSNIVWFVLDLRGVLNLLTYVACEHGRYRFRKLFRRVNNSSNPQLDMRELMMAFQVDTHAGYFVDDEMAGEQDGYVFLCEAIGNTEPGTRLASVGALSTLSTGTGRPPRERRSANDDDLTTPLTVETVEPW
eukprot:m.58929 g.58929  ORF g.58929 m.58929 type:complete len:398 (+) comp12911_c1_seq2:76-1269(+)